MSTNTILPPPPPVRNSSNIANTTDEENGAYDAVTAGETNIKPFLYDSVSINGTNESNGTLKNTEKKNKVKTNEEKKNKKADTKNNKNEDKQRKKSWPKNKDENKKSDKKNKKEEKNIKTTKTGLKDVDCEEYEPTNATEVNQDAYDTTNVTEVNQDAYDTTNVVPVENEETNTANDTDINNYDETNPANNGNQATGETVEDTNDATSSGTPHPILLPPLAQPPPVPQPQMPFCINPTPRRNSTNTPNSIPVNIQETLNNELKETLKKMTLKRSTSEKPNYPMENTITLRKVGPGTLPKPIVPSNTSKNKLIKSFSMAENHSKSELDNSDSDNDTYATAQDSNTVGSVAKAVDKEKEIDNHQDEYSTALASEILGSVAKAPVNGPNKEKYNTLPPVPSKGLSSKVKSQTISNKVISIPMNIDGKESSTTQPSSTSKALTPPPKQPAKNIEDEEFSEYDELDANELPEVNDGEYEDTNNIALPEVNDEEYEDTNNIASTTTQSSSTSKPLPLPPTKKLEDINPEAYDTTNTSEDINPNNITEVEEGAYEKTCDTKATDQKKKKFSLPKIKKIGRGDANTTKK